ISASIVVVIDHFFRGIYYPQSIFGVITTSQWRWVEHGAWVIFENIFLIRSCVQMQTEMKEGALREAQLEAAQVTIQDLIAQVGTLAKEVLNTSDQLTQTSEVMSFDSNDQATHIASVGHVLASMAESVSQSVEMTRQTDEIATRVSRETAAGGEAVWKTVRAIKEIAERVTVIQDIADETNPLSLNAQIEAARVGKVGLGFAVIASEVRKLSEKTHDAAVEIMALAGNSVSAAETAGKLLEIIVPDIQETAGLVQKIATALIEHDTNVQEINHTMDNLSQKADSSAAASEHLLRTAQDMQNSVGHLQDVLSKIRSQLGKRANHLTGP
ncbi:MAG: methyl-accepting chemotaxis protein, partial [bacterium]|nr:methyl-accepting chemotaxis protein [bacterium]